MKQMFQKEYILDHIGSKNTITVLRHLYRNLHRFRSISDIAKEIDVSRSNVHRALKDIDRLGILRTQRTRTRNLVRIDPSTRLSILLFYIFNEESYNEISSDVKNLISTIFTNRIVSDLTMAMLFGSHARGIAHKGSDIDILVLPKTEEALTRVRALARDQLPEHRVEVHAYKEDDLKDPKDLVVIDALLFGISITGTKELFSYRSQLESIEKSYLLNRLRSAKENMDRSRQLDGEAGAYFKKVAFTTLGEIESIIGSGTTIPKSMVDRTGAFEDRIDSLKDEISKRGDRIWLM